MAVSSPLLKTSLNISKISSSVFDTNKKLDESGKTASSIGKTLLKRNKIKKENIVNDQVLFVKRRESVRRKEQESIIESSGLGGAVRRQQSIISDSAKGFLGRILDFTGTLLVGWLLNNLPTIIGLAQELIARIQKFVNILNTFITTTTKVFTSLGSSVGAIFADISKFEFTFPRTRTQVDKTMFELEDAFAQLTGSFDDAVKLFTTPLTGQGGEGSYSGEQVPTPGSTWGGDTTAPPPPGQKYNISQLVGLSQQVGFKGDNAAIAAAVAMAESGGRSDAHNDDSKKPPAKRTGDNSYGLWQINMIEPPLGPQLGAPRRKEFGISKNEELFNPITNGKAALKISGGSNFSAWTTYKNGAHLPHLPAARAALKNPQSAPKPPTPTPGGVKLSPLTGTSGESMGNKPLSTPLSPFLPGKSGPITSGFGYRWGRMHKGYDVGVPEGTPVYAYFPGTVTKVGYDKEGYGYYIEWKDSIHNQTHFFGHLREKPSIGEGSKFGAGTQLAVSGNTGKSTAPHLHWEIGPPGSQIDPGNWLRTVQAKPSSVQPTSISPAPAKVTAQPARRGVPSETLSQPRRGPVVMVSQPQAASIPQMSGGGQGSPMTLPDFIPDTLNRYVKQKLFLELAYT